MNKQELEALVEKWREMYPDDWNVFLDENDVINLKAPRELTMEENIALIEQWYGATAEIQSAGNSASYFVITNTRSAYDKAFAAAARHGLKLVATDDPQRYQVVLKDELE